MTTRQDIIDKAREFIGTPFHHQARLKGIGIDCVGLLVCVANELGIPIQDRTVYTSNPDGVTLKKELDQALNQIYLTEVAAGDVLVFWYTKRQYPQHVAIKTDIGIIHAHQSIHIVTEHSIPPKWQKRIMLAYKYPGVI